MGYEILETLSSGGPLMIPIAGVSLAAWVLIVARWLALRAAGRPDRIVGTLGAPAGKGAVDGALDACARDGGAAGRVLARVFFAFPRGPAGVPEGVYREAELKALAGARRSLGAIAALAAAAPLLGLLGTVTGMIGTFDAITLFGTGNPRPLAEGISEALITTQAGLIVALPILLAHNALARRAERLERGIREALDCIRSLSRGGP